jgi:plastocyanin
VKKLALLLSLLALAAVGLAACGGDDDTTEAAPATETSATDTSATGDTGGGATISVSADPSGQLAYTETELTAAAGSDTIEFDNPAPLEHDVVVEDDSGNEVGRTDTVTNGSTSATVDLEPGTYTFFCSVDGHRAAGMEGTLTVN